MPLTLPDVLLFVFPGVFIATFCLFLALDLALGRTRRHRHRRLRRVTGLEPVKTGGKAGSHDGSSLRRTDPVPRRLRNLEALLSRFPLIGMARIGERLTRAGLKTSLTSYFLITAIVGLVAILGMNAFLETTRLQAILTGAAIGFALPYFTVGIIAQWRAEKFLAGLPDAIDLIIRGIKAGLPVVDSIAVVGEEFSDPIGHEFRAVRDSVLLGTSVDQALATMAERIGKPEVSFLATSVSVQRETGGNLAGALENLSTTLRERQQMKLKIKALSSEARASAYILGAMPFIMGAIIYTLNPEYISVLFTDERGHMMIYGGLGSIALGVIVMARMIRFKI